MYQVLGIRNFLSCYGYLCIFFSVGFLLFYPMHDFDISTLWKVVSLGIATSSFIVLGLGQTSAFPYLCSKTKLCKFFPAVDGDWAGLLHSNWPEIAKLHNLSSNAAPTPIKMKITSRLFYVKIALESIDQYSTSETIFVTVKKAPESDKLRLYYIYDNLTKKPLATDSERHYGAAYLDINVVNNKVTTLDGAYWTNRNWHQAKNTAGTLQLSPA